MTDYRGALETLDRILNRGGDADDVLADGPSAGTPHDQATMWPIIFQGTKVAELEVAPPAEGDEEFLERVATIVSPYCLVAEGRGGPVA